MVQFIDRASAAAAPDDGAIASGSPTTKRSSTASALYPSRTSDPFLLSPYFESRVEAVIQFFVDDANGCIKDPYAFKARQDDSSIWIRFVNIPQLVECRFCFPLKIGFDGNLQMLHPKQIVLR